MNSSHSSSATVDAGEVKYFEESSSSWWDETGGTKLLHSMNKLRIPLIVNGFIDTGKVMKESISSPKPLLNMLILEVGCGGGILTEPLARLGGIVTGLDPGQKLIEQARQHATLDPSLSNLTYCVETIEEHSLRSAQKYDAVVASEVVEHVADPDLFLKACVKCLKPGGSIFITTFNKTKASWLGGIIFAEKIVNLIPQGTHDWEKFISPEQIQRILVNHNCKTVAIQGMGYNFFNNKWYWITSTSINYALHAVRL